MFKYNSYSKNAPCFLIHSVDVNSTLPPCCASLQHYIHHSNCRQFPFHMNHFFSLFSVTPGLLCSYHRWHAADSQRNQRVWLCWTDGVMLWKCCYYTLPLFKYQSSFGLYDVPVCQGDSGRVFSSHSPTSLMMSTTILPPLCILLYVILTFTWYSTGLRCILCTHFKRSVWYTLWKNIMSNNEMRNASDSLSIGYL